MKKLFWPILATLLLLCACQTAKASVTILDGEHNNTLTTTERVPKKLLADANVTLGPNDRLLYLGSSTPLDVALSNANSYTLTVRRAVALTINRPDGQKTIQTSALTVGQALTENGYTLYASDRLDPPADTPVDGPLNINYQPSREFVITADGNQVRIRSAAATVGQALAEAGIPLVGLDYSVPAESETPPTDGQIRVVRVVESVSLSQKALAFNTTSELSADLELDQQALLQGGQPGLAIARVRTRSEDGKQVSQKSESESIIRPPQDRIMGYGTKVVIRTTTVDGQTITYWRALRLFATSYSPCQSAGVPGRCYPNTSSGKKVQRGEVAMVYYWYLLFGGQPIYIPGYGAATIEDVGGGWKGSHYWVDLGWTDAEYQPMSGWMTVYFLVPVPSNPGYILP
jgi:resuscitation-promoting factor RpfB